MDSCPICAKQQGTVTGGPLYADDLVYAYHVCGAGDDNFLGYVRLESRRHVPSFAELTPAESRAVGILTSRLSRALKDATGADHVYVFFYGDHVPHLHLHIFARYPGTPEEFWRERVDEWPGSPKGGPAEVTALCDRLRTALADAPAHH